MRGYKAALVGNGVPVIVTLVIDDNTLTNVARSSVVVKDFAKHRCNTARVESITSAFGKKKSYKEAYSMHDANFKYRVDEIVEVSNYDPNIDKQCAAGIHFFLSHEAAIDYCIENGHVKHKLPVLRSWYSNGTLSCITVLDQNGGVSQEYNYDDTGKLVSYEVPVNGKRRLFRPHEPDWIPDDMVPALCAALGIILGWFLHVYMQ